MKTLSYCYAIALLAALACASSAGVQEGTIELTSPVSGAAVGMRVTVEGIVRVSDMEGRQAVVAVHPLLTDLIWIQPLPAVYEKTPEGFRFRTVVYCGTRDQGLGEQFEVIPLIVKKGAFRQGDRLDKIPENVTSGGPILITRNEK